MHTIRPATAHDVPLILEFIRELAEYEREPKAAVATAEDLLRDGFTLGSEPKFKCVRYKAQTAAISVTSRGFATLQDVGSGSRPGGPN